jgi:hypothetical protein
MHVGRALHRARFAILTIAVAYFGSLLAGIAMVHGGNHFALAQRDRIVSGAQKTSPILKALNHGHVGRAALMDFGANFLLGGVGSALAGYWAPGPYPIAIFRGWVGGIVSVDSSHRSRFRNRAQAFYYIVVILLQLFPCALCGGAGVNIGLARVHRDGCYAGPRWLGIPIEAIRDAARIFILAAPLFLIASLFEFYAS